MSTFKTPLQAAMQPIDSAQLDRDVIEEADVVIVGSGAGGAVAAKELAEGGLKVIILEEGSWHRAHKDLAFDAISRLYRDMGMTSTLGTPIIPVPMGKCYGGTTVINSGTCFRVPDAVSNRWRKEYGLSELGAEELSNAYSRVEKIINVQPSDFAVMGKSNLIIHDVIMKSGFHGAPLLRNIKDCHGCGLCPYGCSSGAKQSMDVSYLPRAHAAGAKAYTHARVKDIVVDPKTGEARGVVAEAVTRQGKRTGRRVAIRAPKVIIAAGTFHTPQLLRENKIAFGNKHLGRHLTLHPATKVYAEFEEKLNGWEGTPQAYYSEELHDDGIMFEGIFTPPDLAGLTTNFMGRKLTDFMKRYANMASFGLMINDDSEGRLIKVPLFGYTYYYRMTPTDVRRIQKGIAFLARAFFKGGALKVYPTMRGWVFDSIEDVERFEKAKISTVDIDCMAFHPLGTCRMSKSPESGVVNENHEVHGHPGLYVCDGSVIPSALGVNPQLTIMAFATRFAHRLLGKPIPATVPAPTHAPTPLEQC